jgi:hypothetical protein
MFFPDALAGETIYRVVGKSMNEAEKKASEDISAGTFSNVRQVRFRVFQWPGENNEGLLVVLQYDFAGAKPALSCPSIGLLAHVVSNAEIWQLRIEYLLLTSHHFSLVRAEFVDLTGLGANELVLESDLGGAGSVGSSLQVFDLTSGNFDELLNTYSRLQYVDQDWFTQVLDVDRTQRTHGRQFCCVKTTLFEEGTWFKPARITHPCYTRGDGIDKEEATERQTLLAPLR